MPWIATDQSGNPYSVVISNVDGSFLTTPAPGVSPSTTDNSITTNAITLISSSLRICHILASGETIPLSEANDGLMVLDQMLDAWNADELAVYTTRSDDYALVIGQQVYTLGPGGFYNTNRPARIDAMSSILLTNPLNPLEVPINMFTVEEWQRKIPVKTVNGSFPQVCYDDGGYPLRTLNMWPIPTQVNNLRIYSWQPLGIPSTLTTGISFPPGYAESFRYNLALRLNGEFAGTMSDDDKRIAIESLARLKTMNAPDLLLQSDLIGNEGGYNYKSDMFGIPW